MKINSAYSTQNFPIQVYEWYFHYRFLIQTILAIFNALFAHRVVLNAEVGQINLLLIEYLVPSCCNILDLPLDLPTISTHHQNTFMTLNVVGFFFMAVVILDLVHSCSWLSINLSFIFRKMTHIKLAGVEPLINSIEKCLKRF